MDKKNENGDFRDEFTLQKVRTNYWPGPSAETCRGFLLYKFWRILPGIFLEDFSGPQK